MEEKLKQYIELLSIDIKDHYNSTLWKEHALKKFYEIFGLDSIVIRLEKRYEIDFRWRQAWHNLSHKLDMQRTLNQQEYIESRAELANQRIAMLMNEFDNIPSA